MISRRHIRGVAGGLALALMLAGCAEQEVILSGQRLDLDGRIPVEPVNRAAAIRLPGQTNLSAWPQQAVGADHLMPHVAFSGTPTVIWATNVGEPNARRHRIVASPVSDGQAIYTLDAKSGVTAVTKAGQVAWQTNLARSSDNVDDASGGGVAVSGGVLFVATGFGELHALQASTGQSIWKQRFDAPVAGAPTISGGRVFVTTQNGVGSVLNAENGRLLWQVQAANAVAGFLGGAAPAVGSQFAIFPFASGQVVATYKGQGLVAWRGSAGGGRAGQVYSSLRNVTADPVLTGGRIYTGTAAGRLVAMNAQDGDVIWRSDVGATGPVVVTGGSVFTVSDQFALVRLDASNGQVVWSADLPDYVPVQRERRKRDVYAHFGPVLAGGHVWVASSDGMLRGFDPVNGQLSAQIAIGAGAASSPIVLGGTMYIVTTDAQLIALR